MRPNYAFKPTAEHGLPPSCRASRGGGLTQALGLTGRAMQSVADSDEGKWLLLRSLTEGKPRLVGVIPELPPATIRAAFPERITIVVAYEADENGLPIYADDLEALNGLEEDIREWDPEEQVFLNAARSTGLGERRWILYASNVEAMESLVPENDLMDISAEHDPEWSEISAILAGVRGEA